MALIDLDNEFLELFYNMTISKVPAEPTLIDLKNYTHSLVVDEMNLGNLIENAVKQMVEQEAKEEDEDVEDELEYDTLDELKDEDFSEFGEFIEEEELSDEELMRHIKEGG